MLYLCRVCARAKTPLYGGFCECGAYSWEPLRAAAPASGRVAARGAPAHRPLPRIPSALDGRGLVRALDTRERLDPRPFPAFLAEALGGIELVSLVCIYGPPGSGKSTLAAELAYVMARALRAPTYWLDAEQRRDALVLECFERVGIGPQELGPDVLRVVRAPRDSAHAPRDLVAAVPARGGGLCVVDSLQALAGESNYALQLDVLTQLSRLQRPVVVVAQVNADGDVRGPVTNAHCVDATVRVSPEGVSVRKCRWARVACPYDLARPPLPARADSLEEVH